MSILTFTPAAPSLEEKKQLAAHNIKNTAANTYKRLTIAQKEGIDFVWNNGQGLTPQQVCDALGTSAVKVFDLHAVLTEALLRIAIIDGVQPDIALPTYNFTRNQDGTVTILDTPYNA